MSRRSIGEGRVTGTGPGKGQCVGGKSRVRCGGGGWAISGLLDRRGRSRVSRGGEVLFEKGGEPPSRDGAEREDSVGLPGDRRLHHVADQPAVTLAHLREDSGVSRTSPSPSIPPSSRRPPPSGTPPAPNCRSLYYVKLRSSPIPSHSLSRPSGSPSSSHPEIVYLPPCSLRLSLRPLPHSSPALLH